MTDPLFGTFADHPCMISASHFCYVELLPTILASMAKAGWHGLSADLCKFWSKFKLTMLCIFNLTQKDVVQGLTKEQHISYLDAAPR